MAKILTRSLKVCFFRFWLKNRYHFLNRQQWIFWKSDYYYYYLWYSYMLYLVHYPKDCSDLKYKRSKSGVYRISPDNVKPFKVYCDMETDGGSWTVSIIQCSGLFLLCVYICVNVWNPNIKRGLNSDPIIRFSHAIFMCLSKVYTWIYIGIGHGVLCSLIWDEI